MKKTPYQILVAAFRALPAKQRQRLREHAKRRTPIACGHLADYFYVDGRG